MSKITIELDDDMIAHLRVVASNLNVEESIEELVATHSAFDDEITLERRVVHIAGLEANKHSELI